MSTSGTTAKGVVYPISTDTVALSTDLTAMANSINNNFVGLSANDQTITNTSGRALSLRREGGDTLLGIEANYSSGPVDGKKWAALVATDYSFKIRPYTDAWATTAAVPLSLSRDGYVTLSSDPSNSMHAANKGYVDSAKHPSEMYAFLARHTSTQNLTPTPAVVTFGSEAFDVGGVWNNTTYEFTFPVNSTFYIETAINFAATASTVSQVLTFQIDSGGGYSDHRTFTYEGGSGSTASSFRLASILLRGTAGTKVKLMGSTAAATWTTGSATQRDQNHIQGFMVSAF
jgi:hypothetical protein